MFDRIIDIPDIRVPSIFSLATMPIMAYIPAVFIGRTLFFTIRRGTWWNEKASLRVPQACSIHTCGQGEGGGRMSLVNLKVVAAVYLTGFTLMREMVMAVAQSHYLPGG